MKISLSIIVFGFLFASCKKVPGCTDLHALNYEYSAEVDNGTCYYSSTTFYAKYGYYSGIPINQIDIAVDGSAIGSINSVYPSGPGNCSATGTVTYEHYDGDNHDWNSTVYLANGAVVYGSGTVKSSSSIDCKKMNVTN